MFFRANGASNKNLLFDSGMCFMFREPESKEGVFTFGVGFLEFY